MSEKLFSRLYWRPYLLTGVSMLLVMLGELALYALPHQWLSAHYSDYGLYLVKGVTWLVKLSILIYLFGVYKAVRGNCFPVLTKLCSKETRAVISGYSKSWTRGKLLCPIFSYRVDGQEYSEPLNEARGSRTKEGERPDKGFALKQARKIRYNPAEPREFYIMGEEYYSRKGAVVRFVLFSLLFFLQLYLNVFMY